MDKITFEFATHDDCLDKIVPSDLRILVAERDAMQDRIAELEQERDQLKAQNAVLVGQLTNAVNHLTRARRNYTKGLDEPIDSMNRAISKSPAVCIADIQARAIEDFQTYFDKEYYGEELSQFIEQYADKLRQQSKAISE